MTITIIVFVAVCNVLLPSLIKLRFPESTGVMTGIYITIMNLWGAIGLGFSIPIAQVLGWLRALGCWAALAFLATVVWIPQSTKKATIQQMKRTKPRIMLWRSLWLGK